MRPVPLVPAARHGVFTSREAVRAGWSPAALDRAVRSERLVRLDRGLYALPVEGSGPKADQVRFTRTSVAAVMSVGPAHASHRSAAALDDLPLWTVPSRPCITVPPRYTGDARHSHLHRATILLSHQSSGSVPRLRPARTVIDIARESGIEQAAVVGDAALHLGRTDVDELAAVVQFCRDWPGARRAVGLLPLLDGRSESPLETVSRLRLIRNDFPAPEPQMVIRDLYGRFLGRVDLYWDRYGVVGEVDGLEKYREDPFGVWQKERSRQERIIDTGLVVVRWGRNDLDDLPRLVARLRAAFDRGLRVRSERRWIAEPTTALAPRITA